MSIRRLTDEPLHVESHLIGAAVASPVRRVVAFRVDCLLLILPTVAVATGAAALTLHERHPRAFDALVSFIGGQRTATARVAPMRELAPVFVELEAPGMPAAATLAVEEGDLNRAAQILKAYDVGFSLALDDEGGEAPPLPPHTIRFPVEKLIPSGVRAIVLLGVPALYFVFFSRTRGCATPGKRLMGLRVVRLDGERLSWLESLERFIGYVHIPGTMFISLVDLWRDPNRRLPHDRVVHTAVIRATGKVVRPPEVREVQSA